MLPDVIEHNSDLPEPLNTATKQERRAKQLAAAHLGKKAYKAQGPDIQGYFSRTQIVKLVGGDRIVIQFRIQPLETECFKKARRLLGDMVPDVNQLQDDELEALGVTVYAMSYMPGRCWFRIPNPGTETRVKIAESLGTILGRGCVKEQSTKVVDNYIIPRLERFRSSITEATRPLQTHVERLIAAAPQVKRLPLYFSHHDLNEMNVLIGEDHMVSGIVDWECAKDLPFGMGLHRLTDTIVAQNSEGQIEISEGSKEAETAFWNAVLRNAPSVVLENLNDVQNALHIGSLLFAFEEKHLEGPNPAVEFLAGILTYRLPQLRGNTSPFSPEFISK